MNVRDDIAADLPAPRDDEPESLRRDIVDELADHLQCALNRELLARGGRQKMSGRGEPADSPGTIDDEQTAWQQVLTRFGPPGQIARQLWLDAMKERIMAQRFTAVMATVAAAACLLMCAFLWQVSIRQSHLQSRLDEEKALNASLMAELKSMLQESSTAATNAGWAPVQVKLQSAEGAPVAGRVKIEGTAINAGNDNKIDVSVIADKSGVADFGLLPFGNYDMEIVATAIGREHRKSLMLSPNTPPALTIVCPTDLPPEVAVSFEVDVPEPLHMERLVFAAFIQRSSLKTAAGSWSVADHSERTFEILFKANGTILGEATEMATLDASRTIPGGSFAARAGFGTSQDSKPFNCRVAPPRAVRAGDQCVGISVAARLPADSGDPSVLPLVFTPVVYSAEVVGAQFFEDSDPSDERMNVRFDLPTSVWSEVVTAFRRSPEVADVTVPDGWQVLTIPTDLRPLVSRGIPSRGGRGSRGNVLNPVESRFRVMVDLASDPAPPPLPLVTAESILLLATMEDIGVLMRRGRMSSSTPFDLPLLVNAEQAEAIELARSVGTLAVVPVRDDDAEDAGVVNAETLDTIRQLVAEQKE